MKLDEKIQFKRLAYLLKKENHLAFELALLYFVQAKRRAAEEKIHDSCLKSIQWLKRAGIAISENLQPVSPADQLKSIEQILVKNKTMICPLPAEQASRATLVRAIPNYIRDIGFVPQH